MDLARLVTRATSGDRQARDDLLKRATQLVYARVFRTVGNRPAAKDVAQDALVAALTGLPGLRNPQAFLPWLRRITDRAVADHFAARRKWPHGAQDTLDRIPAVGRPADRALEQAEERRRVRAALDELPPRSRLAIELFYFHDLTSREVADFLRISDDAARATLSRSRKELRRHIMGITDTEKTERRIRHSVKGGEATFPGPIFAHDSDTAKLYLALYPTAGADAAASTGLPPECIRQELVRLQNMKLIVPQGDGWRCTMPAVNETDLELIRVWAEPVADVVIRRLDALHREAAALAVQVDGDLAKDTVRTFGLLEAVRRPFSALRERLEASAPDRGTYGSFCAAVFTCDFPGRKRLSGGWSYGYSDDDGAEVYTYYFHPSHTDRSGTEAFNRAFSLDQKRGPAVLGALRRMAPDALQNGLTDQHKAKITDMLKVATERCDAFWSGLVDLHVTAERGGRTEVIVPTLPLAPWKAYLSRLDRIGEEITETVADAADDLRKRAARCSFADGYFADAVMAFFSCLEGIVQQAIADREPLSFPDEADFSWGALIVA